MTPVLKTLSQKEEERSNDSTQLPFAEHDQNKKPYGIVCCKLQCQFIYNLFFKEHTCNFASLIKLFIKTYEQF